MPMGFLLKIARLERQLPVQGVSPVFVQSCWDMHTGGCGQTCWHQQFANARLNVMPVDIAHALSVRTCTRHFIALPCPVAVVNQAAAAPTDFLAAA